MLAFSVVDIFCLFDILTVDMLTVGNRELPPRFQRKQQQLQQKDQTFSATDVGHSQSPPNFAAMQCADTSLYPGAFHPGATDIGSFGPMIPPAVNNVGVAQGPVATGNHRVNANSASDDVSLRPARNFTPLLKPNTPAALPKSVQSTHPQQNARMMVIKQVYYVTFLY